MPSDSRSRSDHPSEVPLLVGRAEGGVQPLQAKVRNASAPCEASSCRGRSFHTPRLLSHSLRYARSRRRPKSQAPSSNWQRAKAARAAAIASSLLRGRSTMTGWQPRLLITPLVSSPHCVVLRPPLRRARVYLRPSRNGFDTRQFTLLVRGTRPCALS